MGSTLCILAGEPPAKSDQALAKFARFLGLHVEFIPLGEELTEPPPALLASETDGRLVALGRPWLPGLMRCEWFAQWLAETPFVFAYGFAPADDEGAELKWLTGGALASVASLSPGSHRFTVHDDVTYGNFPVSGRSYSWESGAVAAFSSLVPGPGTEVYITVNGRPHFVSVKRGRSLVFLLAGAELVDIDTRLAPAVSLRPWYAQLVALSIVLRAAAGPSCWTSPVTGATFIVDDPGLKPRYGFVRYETLAPALERSGGALTVAFIPYNHRRSDPRTVARMRSLPARFSIAVHGCDHTGGEFDCGDAAWLAGTTARALQRMEDHARRTGLPFDNVMVFPQGRFSTTAVGALQSCGLAAAVNSTPWPGDWPADPLTIRDLLDVAVTRYDKFPIFVRRYPGDLFDFAFDALFQKPVLAVEHHGFFRDGNGALTKFIREVSTLDPKLHWMPLGRSVTASCVVRSTNGGQWTLKHYAPVLAFRNRTPEDLTLSVEKPEQDDRVEGVWVGNQNVAFAVQAGMLHYTATVAAGAELNVVIRYRPTPRVPLRPTWKYRVKVAARRRLSDFRDNQLAGSPRLLAIAERCKERLARRGKASRNS